MSEKSKYEEYVADGTFMASYLDYQRRYASDIRESDKVLIQKVRALREEMADKRDLVVLDLGCSTGNLLKHLSKSVPGLSLVGGELSDAALEECRSNPDLAGMPFEKMNVVDLQDQDRFDVIIVNAVLYMMDDDEFTASLRGIHRALKQNGYLLVFDFFHRFPQHLAITETSRSHPDGLTLYFRPISETQQLLEHLGYGTVEFSPFEIPIDLQARSPDEPDAWQDLHSYTISDSEGQRLLFRGTLFQPWCHLMAQKAP